MITGAIHNKNPAVNRVLNFTFSVPFSLDPLSSVLSFSFLWVYSFWVQRSFSAYN